MSLNWMPTPKRRGMREGDDYTAAHGDDWLRIRKDDKGKWLLSSHGEVISQHDTEDDAKEAAEAEAAG